MLCCLAGETSNQIRQRSMVYTEAMLRHLPSLDVTLSFFEQALPQKQLGPEKKVKQHQTTRERERERDNERERERR